MNYQKLRLALRPADPQKLKKNAIREYKKQLLKQYLETSNVTVRKEPTLTKYIQEEIYDKGTYLSLTRQKFYENVNAIQLSTKVYSKAKFALKFGVFEYLDNVKNIYAVPLSGCLSNLKKYQQHCIKFIKLNNSARIAAEKAAEETDINEFIMKSIFFEPLYKRDRDYIMTCIKKLGSLEANSSKNQIELVCIRNGPLHPSTSKLNTYPLRFEGTVRYIEDKKEHENIIRQFIGYIVSSRDYENFKGNP